MFQSYKLELSYLNKLKVMLKDYVKSIEDQIWELSNGDKILKRKNKLTTNQYLFSMIIQYLFLSSFLIPLKIKGKLIYFLLYQNILIKILKYLFALNTIITNNLIEMSQPPTNLRKQFRYLFFIYKLSYEKFTEQETKISHCKHVDGSQ